ncbi:MAG: acyltransferase domain-containing protein, partial [Verrucomicrobiaceae bacterium]
MFHPGVDLPQLLHRVVAHVECHHERQEFLQAEVPTPGSDEIDVVQPALFAVQIGLAMLWQSWGIIPEAVVGHSLGEVAAAHVAGILSLEDATRIICCRSKILKQLSGHGKMLATGLSHEQAKAFLHEIADDVSIAVINSPSSTILSG